MLFTSRSRKLAASPFMKFSVAGVVLFASTLTVRAQTAYPRIPEYRTLEKSLMRISLLPGSDQFVFTNYGAPGDVGDLRELVDQMKRQHLGNGFDPVGGTGAGIAPVSKYLAEIGWPGIFYSGAEMQIKGGRAVFGAETRAAMSPMVNRPLFTALQLGEWGYYFHNLANNADWWHGVYGSDFEQFKHLMKPTGLAGYDRKPASKQECFDVLKDYFTSRKMDLGGRIISVTGHSHYEAYAGEWGAACIGLEVGENIAFTQSKLAFARGASRRWSTPWSVQVSPWFGPSCTSSGPLRTESGIVRGLDAGHSLSFYERMWLHGWFAGAAMVTPENSMATTFENPGKPWALTPYGQLQATVFPFMQAHDRGIPYTPVAVVIDHLAGYNGYMDKPWGILDPTPGDRMLRDLFDYQLFPGSDSIHHPADTINPEASYLRATPYGEIFDVQLSNVGPEMMAAYPIIVLAGDINFDAGLVSSLKFALKSGSRVLISQNARDNNRSVYTDLNRSGTVETLENWINPATNRPTSISNERLQRMASLLPISVTGSIQYEINRNRTGWIVELINNQGVAKRGDQKAVVDLSASVKVRLKPAFKLRSFEAWRNSKIIRAGSNGIEVEVGPGAVEYIEFKL